MRKPHNYEHETGSLREATHPKTDWWAVISPFIVIPVLGAVVWMLICVHYGSLFGPFEDRRKNISIVCHTAEEKAVFERAWKDIRYGSIYPRLNSDDTCFFGCSSNIVSVLTGHHNAIFACVNCFCSKRVEILNR